MTTYILTLNRPLFCLRTTTDICTLHWPLFCIRTTYLFTLNWPLFCRSRWMVKRTIKHRTDVHIIQATAIPPTTSEEYNCVFLSGVLLSTNTEMVRTTWFREQPISPFNEWLRFTDLMHSNCVLVCSSLGLLRKLTMHANKKDISLEKNCYGIYRWLRW